MYVILPQSFMLFNLSKGQTNGCAIFSSKKCVFFRKETCFFLLFSAKLCLRTDKNTAKKSEKGEKWYEEQQSDQHSPGSRGHGSFQDAGCTGGRCTFHILNQSFHYEKTKLKHQCFFPISLHNRKQIINPMRNIPTQ